MTIFRYSEPIYKRDIPPVCSCHGTEEVDDFKLTFPVTGGVRLEKIGTKPLYKQIQANKVNCDLSSVLEQCVHQNQLDICDPTKVTDAIADFTGLSSMAEWYAGMKNLEQVWKETPLDVREQFGSSQVQFMNAIGTPEFNNKLNIGFNSYYESINKRIDVPLPTSHSETITSSAETTTPPAESTTPPAESTTKKGSDK